jgi:hypothetical protein
MGIVDIIRTLWTLWANFAGYIAGGLMTIVFIRIAGLPPAEPEVLETDTVRVIYHVPERKAWILLVAWPAYWVGMVVWTVVWVLWLIICGLVSVIVRMGKEVKGIIVAKKN